MTDQPPRRRATLENVLSRNECLHLISIARCCSAVGYRDNCCAVTSTVIARICPQFLPKLVIIRERIRDAVEQALGLELSLLIEFTGLVSWRPGSIIGWHTDSNRSYLTQRYAAAVVYLNESNLDFQGGNFKFRNKLTFEAQKDTKDEETRGIGEENLQTETEYDDQVQVQIESIDPVPGRVIAYTTSEEHCVDPQITSGERFTLSMWFTTDIEYDEDSKILATLMELENSKKKIENAANEEINGKSNGDDNKEGVSSFSQNEDDDVLSTTVPAAMHALHDGVDIRLCRLACYGICILKKVTTWSTNGTSKVESWVPMRSLKDGEWDQEQVLQLGILVSENENKTYSAEIRAGKEEKEVNKKHKMVPSSDAEVAVVVLKGENERINDPKGGGGILMSVQQAVIAVQSCLLKIAAPAAAAEETHCSAACERVCSRHLNAFPEKVAPRQEVDTCCCSCSWLDEPEKIIIKEVQAVEMCRQEDGSFSSLSAIAEKLRVLKEAIYSYRDVEEQMRVWEQTKERWLKAGAVF